MKENESKQACPHQQSVYCHPSEKHCDSCGWNPVVARRRLRRIIEKRKAEAKGPATKFTKTS